MLKFLLVLLAFQNSQQTVCDKDDSEYAATRAKNDMFIINTLTGIIISLCIVVLILTIIELI